MWDAADPSVFVVADGAGLYVYLYHPVSLTGPRIDFVGKQPLQASHTPLMCCNGNVGCRLKSGALDTLTLETHRLGRLNGSTVQDLLDPSWYAQVPPEQRHHEQGRASEEVSPLM